MDGITIDMRSQDADVDVSEDFEGTNGETVALPNGKYSIQNISSDRVGYVAARDKPLGTTVPGLNRLKPGDWAVFSISATRTLVLIKGKAQFTINEAA